jgi:hypothetical protein
VAERRVHSERGDVSPLFVRLGPTMRMALNVTQGDEAAARGLLADVAGWQAEYADAWLGGDPVPPPPHNDTLGRFFAKPARRV